MVVSTALLPDGEGVQGGGGRLKAGTERGEGVGPREVMETGTVSEDPPVMSKELDGAGRRDAPSGQGVNGRVKDEHVEMGDGDDRVGEARSRAGTLRSMDLQIPTLVISEAPPLLQPPKRDVVSLKAKMEFIEQGLPNENHDLNAKHPSARTNGGFILPRAPSSAGLPTKPNATPRLPLLRQHSREDGEISTIATTIASTATPTVAATAISSNDNTSPPTAKRPPTGPRSFRASPPYLQPIGNNGRPVPSAPRAFRAIANGNNGNSNSSSAAATQYNQPALVPNRTYSGMQALPRGPSADRDKNDWERERSWTASSRTRGGGWGR